MAISKKTVSKFVAKEITDDNLDHFLKGFPEKHKRFCFEYSKCWNAKAAYKRIHPESKDTTAKSAAYKLLQNDMVQMFLEYLGKKNAKEYEISKDWLIKKTKQVLDQSMAAVPVSDIKGNPIGEYVFNGSAANQAIKMLGSEVGYGIPNVKLETQISNKIQVAIFVVEKLRPIDMADSDFQGDVNEAIRKHMQERVNK